jgi:ribosomal protein S27AE
MELKNHLRRKCPHCGLELLLVWIDKKKYLKCYSGRCDYKEPYPYVTNSKEAAEAIRNWGEP